MGKVKKPHLQVSPFKKLIDQAKSIKDIGEDYMVISLRHLDRNQGQNLHQWEQEFELANAIEALSGYCSNSLRSQQSEKFTIYKEFPPKEKTEFSHPKQVPEDAEWARIHVTGKRCLIGHVFKNIFFLVFLDAEHLFWKSEKKHT